jgi:hypothetical protein
MLTYANETVLMTNHFMVRPRYKVTLTTARTSIENSWSEGRHQGIVQFQNDRILAMKKLSSYFWFNGSSSDTSKEK